MAAIRRAVLQAPGQADEALRRASFASARAVARGDELPSALPDDVARVVDKVARDPWKVTDTDVEHLAAAGYSEDAIFEVVVATAAGAGLGRLERALEAFDSAGGSE